MNYIIYIIMNYIYIWNKYIYIYNTHTHTSVLQFPFNGYPFLSRQLQLSVALLFLFWMMLLTYLWSIKSTSKKQLRNNVTDCSLFKYFKAMLVRFAWEVSYCITSKPWSVKRSEMISKCRHLNKFLLINFNSND